MEGEAARKRDERPTVGLTQRVCVWSESRHGVSEVENTLGESRKNCQRSRHDSVAFLRLIPPLLVASLPCVSPVGSLRTANVSLMLVVVTVTVVGWFLSCDRAAPTRSQISPLFIHVTTNKRGQRERWKNYCGASPWPHEGLADWINLFALPFSF